MSHIPCLSELLIRAISQHGDRVAIGQDGRRMTYAQLHDVSDRLAGFLSARGIGKGGTVALLLPSCIEYAVCDIAIVKLGAVKVPLSHMMASEEIVDCLQTAAADALICDSRFAGLRGADVPGIKVWLSTGEGAAGFATWGEALRSEPLNATAQVEPADRAVVVFTGGTTGSPKGIDHRQGPLAACLLSQVLNAEIHREEALLLTTPLPHSAGWFLQAAFYQGARVELMQKFEPEAFVRTALAIGATWTFAVPTMLYRVLDWLGDGKAPPLRTIVYGAAPMDPGRLMQAQERFGRVFIQLYGQSECPNFITRLTKDDHQRQELLRSCGRAVSFGRIEVRRDTGEPCAMGEIGEVYVTSAYTMAGYLSTKAEVEQPFVGAWMRTGDLGYLTAEGYLFLVDRAKDMIITGGLNVYSVEVENALRHDERVNDVAVIGLPDADWGERVVAVVVPNVRVDPESLRLRLRDRISTYKIPKQIEFVDTLPTTRFGKIDKKALRVRHGS
jgi:fatty-acyl-CoA synthase/long-chain acyl-CoA synthetase